MNGRGPNAQSPGAATPLQEILDPLTGITTGLRTITLDPGSPEIFNATVRMADTSLYLRDRCHGRNGGAGLSEREAWNAALGEAVERYCVSAVDPAAIVFGSWNELRHGIPSPLHPSEIALFADFQRDAVPCAPFIEDTRIAWIPGESLVNGRKRLVPACLVHIPYRPLFAGEAIIGPAISTGLACGSSRESALLAGLLECIERDAFSITWLNRLSPPRLVLDEPGSLDLARHRFLRPNLQYHLFLLTLDLPAPTVVSLIEDNNFDPALLCVGGACRLDARDATVKALVESVQGWTWARYERLRSREEPRPASFDAIEDFDSRVHLYACSDMREAVEFLLLSEDRVSLSELPRRQESADDALGSLIGQVGALGTEVIAVDLTTPEIAELGLKVLKAYCPGLQQLEGDHRHPLLGGTRWREAPVRIGLRKEPIGREELNPYPHPYP